MGKVVWKNDGWTCVQEADVEKHILEVNCRAEDGAVVEVRIRHNDGEEKAGTVLLDGENALPMSIADFSKAFAKGKLDIR